MPAQTYDVAQNQKFGKAVKLDLLRLAVASREKTASYHKLSEDFALIDTENKIFGVYDGMGGGGGNPAAAARAAAEATHTSLLGSGNPGGVEELRQSLINAFIAARKAVTDSGRGGSTVATIVKIAKIGNGVYAGIAHAGDTSLLWYSPGNQTYKSLTADQADGNVVDNALINGRDDNQLDEYKCFELSKGGACRFVLCSDGVTGNWDSERPSTTQIEDALRQTSPDAAAEMLLDSSKKEDDKTVIVVDVLNTG